MNLSAFFVGGFHDGGRVARVLPKSFGIVVCAYLIGCYETEARVPCHSANSPGPGADAAKLFLLTYTVFVHFSRFATFLVGQF